MSSLEVLTPLRSSLLCPLSAVEPAMWDNNSNLQQHTAALIQQGDLRQEQRFQKQLAFLQTHPVSPQECAAERVERELMMTFPDRPMYTLMKGPIDPKLSSK